MRGFLPAWQLDHTADKKFLLLLISGEEVVISAMHFNEPANLTIRGPIREGSIALRKRKPRSSIFSKRFNFVYTIWCYRTWHL